MPPPLLRMHAVTKRFGAVQALCGVELEVAPGEVHALIGENGAGKSTLVKILSGALRPDGGSLEMDGAAYLPRDPLDARRRGIAMIYQELTLAPHLSVEENITLGIERRRFGWVRTQAAEVRRALEALGHARIDPRARVAALGMGERQIVEIARALLVNARLVILDEPTSSLSSADTEALFAAVRRLRERGVTFIYISHFLEEVRRIADRYTVLRDGRSVASGGIGGTSLSHLVQAMVGRPLGEMFPRVPHAPGQEALRVEGLSRPPQVVDVSFSVRKGEILGIAGLVGAGRTELLRCVYGLDRADAGAIAGAGAPMGGARSRTPWSSLRSAVGFVSESRADEGLAAGLSIRDNVTLSSLRRFEAVRGTGLIDLRRERATVRERCAAFSLRCRDEMQRAGDLSGGNQQKVVIARIMTEGSTVLLLDEPTRGIDVGSKAEIYRWIGECAARGFAVVMVSSYLPELFGVCDTLAVMHRGRLSPARPVGAWTEESVMRWATTGRDE